MYKEDKLAAAPHRRRIVSETVAYIESLRADCDIRRADYFKPDLTSPEAYAESVKKYREDFIKLLGKPLTEYPSDIPTKAERVLVCDEGDFTIERLWVEVLPGLSSYGLLFVPKAEGKHPYVTAFHGGGGTCEIVSTIYPDGSANYRDLVMRIREKTGAVVYAPQLMLWYDNLNSTEDASEKSDNIGYNNKLRQVGSSLAALEVFKVMRTVDWICANLPVDTDRMGVAGLSYGGFYTLMNAAIDTRYKAALSSCWFADRYKHPWGDWIWEDHASKIMDAEIASLVCPRYLCIEVGEKDNLFPGKDSEPVAVPVAERYAALGLSNSFRFNIHAGDHEFNRADCNLEWFAEKLLN